MKQSITFLSMLLAVLFTNAQTKILVGGSINYYVPTSTQKNNTSPFMFLNSAQSAGVDFTVITKKSKVALKLSADYVTGSNNADAPAKYAKMKDIIYSKYSYTKSKPGGFLVSGGPRVTIFPKAKKMPFMWLDFKAGALFSNQQTLQYFSNGQTTANKEISTKAVSFVYSPTLTINVINAKKMFVNGSVGYSSLGGIKLGVSITERDCTGALCPRCQGPYCIPY